MPSQHIGLFSNPGSGNAEAKKQHEEKTKKPTRSIFGHHKNEQHIGMLSNPGSDAAQARKTDKKPSIFKKKESKKHEPDIVKAMFEAVFEDLADPQTELIDGEAPRGHQTGSRRRRGRVRGPRRLCASRTDPRRASMQIFRGDELRRRHGFDVDIP